MYKFKKYARLKVGVTKMAISRLILVRFECNKNSDDQWDVLLLLQLPVTLLETQKYMTIWPKSYPKFNTTDP